MKNIFLFAMIAIFSLSAYAQTKNDVPAKVQSSFNEKFPDAQKVHWDKENTHEWEAEFKKNGREYSANFGLDGEWIETEYEIKKSAIPAAVKTALNKEFAGYRIEEAEVSETAKEKVYEFKIEKGNHELEVIITPNGKIIKKETKNEEDGD